MSNNLQLQVILSAVDKLTAPFRNASNQARELAGRMRTNRIELNNVRRQMRQNQAAIDAYRNKLNPLKNNLAETNNKLKDAQATVKRMEQAMRGMSNPTDAFKNRLKQARQAVNNLKQAQSEQATKLRQTREEMARNGINARQLSQRQRELQQRMNTANQSIQQQQQRLARLNRQARENQRHQNRVQALRTSADKLQNIGQRSMIAGAGITAPIAGSVRDYMNFEDAMIGVARQVQGLKDDAGNFTPEFEEWKNKIQALSRELPLTTIEIANMIESAARMDTPKEQLEEFVRLNTQMATAFDAANPDELVEQFGKVSKNFKLSAAGTRELADAINYLDDNAISKGTDIIGFMNRVSGIAGIAKITDKNMAALGSTLQTAGAAEEQSATAVNAIFTRLSSASKKKPVRNALSALGMSAGQVELDMVKDAQGTIMKIVDALKKVPEQKRLGFIADLVGTEHTKTLALLVSNTEEWKRQIALANSEMAKGSMGREFDTRMKALSSTWGILKNSLFNLNATIGGTLAPTITKLMQKMSGVLDRVNEWIKANPELATKIMGGAAAVGGSLTVFGALSSLLSFILYPVARLALGFGRIIGMNTAMGRSFAVLKRAIGMQSGLWGKFGITIQWLTRTVLSPFKYIFIAIKAVIAGMLSPIGLVAAAFIIAGTLIYKYWDQIKAFFSGFFEGLMTGLAPVIEKFKPLGAAFGVIVDWLKQAWQWLSDLLSPVQSSSAELEKAKNAGVSFGQAVAKAIELILTPLTSVIDGVTALIDLLPSLDTVKNTISGAWDSTKNTVSDTWNNTKNKVSSAWENTKDSLSGAWKRTQNFFDFKWSGGYAGNGGKYEPKGIYHGGEYIITKEATARLGVPLLNALNYGRKAAVASMLGVGVATAQPVNITPPTIQPAIVETVRNINIAVTQQNPNSGYLPIDIKPIVPPLTATIPNIDIASAQPVKIDNRPPLNAKPQTRQTVSQPMQVTININAAQGQSAEDIARMVQRELAKLDQQRQAKQRSDLRDND